MPNVKHMLMTAAIAVAAVAILNRWPSVGRRILAS